ncbi:MAG: GH13_16 / GH13_36 / GH13_31 / GH13_23 / GH13_ 40 / GH13_17 / GH13 / GH13_29 / GH13_30 / GH13_35 / GH13_4 / GH13_20 / GH13_2 / GH13_1 / GH13_18 / GH13 _19 / GH13_21 / GH13_26, partial [uncultured Gemmatimonadetes bacterium]
GEQRPVVARRRHLRGGRGDVPGQRRGRQRRLRGAHQPAGLPARPGRELPLASALLSRPRPRQRLRRLRLLRRGPALRRRRRLRGVPARSGRPRDAGDGGPGGQPHLRPAPLVPGGAPGPRIPLPRLLHLGGRAARRAGVPADLSRGGAERLAPRRGGGAVLLPHVLPSPALPEPRQPPGARGSQAHHWLLAAAGRQRLPRGRRVAHAGAQGEHGLSGGPAPRAAGVPPLCRHAARSRGPDGRVRRPAAPG